MVHVFLTTVWKHVLRIQRNAGRHYYVHEDKKIIRQILCGRNWNCMEKNRGVTMNAFALQVANGIGLGLGLIIAVAFVKAVFHFSIC